MEGLLRSLGALLGSCHDRVPGRIAFIQARMYRRPGHGPTPFAKEALQGAQLPLGELAGVLS